MANIKRANTSGVTKSGVAITDVPDAPTIGTATGVGLAASVTYTAATTGGTPTTFTAISTPGALTGTGSSPITVSGLTAGTSYTFTVRASNSTGNSPLSSSSNSITAVSPLSGGYDALATIIVPSGGLSSVTFAGIPSGYKHLQIRLSAQTNRSAATGDYLEVRFNSDSGNNYNGHFLGGNGGAAVSGVQGNTNVMYVERVTCSTQTNIFGAIVWDILDYSSTSKNKTSRFFGGYDVNGDASTTNIQIGSGLWLNSSSPITSISIDPGVGTALNQYSQFSLYGIK